MLLGSWILPSCACSQNQNMRTSSTITYFCGIAFILKLNCAKCTKIIKFHSNLNDIYREHLTEIF